MKQIVGLMALVLVSIVVTPDYNIFYYLVYQNAHVILISCAMVGLLLLGHIDLSLGVLAGTSVLIAYNINSVMFIPIAVCISTVIGGFNAYITMRTRSPYITTLSMMFILRGVAVVVSKGKSTPIILSLNNFTITILTLIVATAAWCLLHKTTYGLEAWGVGDCEIAATAEGVKSKNIKLSMGLLAGLIAGIAGVLFTSKMSSVAPLTGINWEVEAIAACIVGGCSFNGGWSKIHYALRGCAILILSKHILYTADIPTEAYWIVIGIILLLNIKMEEKVHD